MPRWHYTRPRNHLAWDRVPRVDRFAGLLAAERAAEEAGAVLRGQQPEPGFTSSAHSRDGKQWVCSATTQGARPAWIWTGDV